MIAHDLSGVEPFSLRRFRNRKGIIAEVDERLEDGAEVCAFGAGEEPGNILKDGESGILTMGGTPHFTNNTDCLKEEAASLALVQTCLLAGDGLILTRAAKGQHIDGSNLITAHIGYAA